jgi:hypothetical protein
MSLAEQFAKQFLAFCKTIGAECYPKPSIVDVVLDFEKRLAALEASLKMPEMVTGSIGSLLSKWDQDLYGNPSRFVAGERRRIENGDRVKHRQRNAEGYFTVRAVDYLCNVALCENPGSTKRFTFVLSELEKVEEETIAEMIAKQEIRFEDLGVEAANNQAVEIIPCTCSLDDLMIRGCKCGAMK